VKSKFIEDSTMDYLEKTFQNNKVELQIEEGEPFFNAKQVCEVLGYKNTQDAIAKHVDRDSVAKRDSTDSIGRKRKINFIDESGLYELIFSSKKKEVRTFRKWVTKEVLPSIRRKGYYSKPELQIESLLKNQEELILCENFWRERAERLQSGIPVGTIEEHLREYNIRNNNS